MLKLKYFISIFVLMIVSIGVCSIKYYVKELERETQELNQQVFIENENIAVLKAEWAYLNKPERLRHLVSKYLTLQALEPNQIYNTNVATNMNKPSIAKPVIAHHRTQLSDSLLIKVGYDSNQKIEKIKWDSKKNKFVKIIKK